MLNMNLAPLALEHLLLGGRAEAVSVGERAVAWDGVARWPLGMLAKARALTMFLAYVLLWENQSYCIRS